MPESHRGQLDTTCNGTEKSFVSSNLTSGSKLDPKPAIGYNLTMNECSYVECHILTPNPKFCSLSCSAKQQMINQKPKPRVRDCARDGCSETFQISAELKNYAKKYCSHSCSAKVSNVSRKVKVTSICLYCGEACKLRGSSFCSVSHSAKYRNERLVENWLAGTDDGTTSTGLLKRTVRNYLVERRAGNRCESPNCCVSGGWAEKNPVTDRVPLEVEHIDGDYTNNSPENLIVLCPNCHALTPTYRALNRGNGRAYRGKYDQFARVDKSTEQVVD